MPEYTLRQIAFLNRASTLFGQGKTSVREIAEASRGTSLPWSYYGGVRAIAQAQREQAYQDLLREYTLMKMAETPEQQEEEKRTSQQIGRDRETATPSSGTAEPSTRLLAEGTKKGSPQYFKFLGLAIPYLKGEIERLKASGAKPYDVRQVARAAKNQPETSELERAGYDYEAAKAFAGEEAALREHSRFVSEALASGAVPTERYGPSRMPLEQEREYFEKVNRQWQIEETERTGRGTAVSFEPVVKAIAVVAVGVAVPMSLIPALAGIGAIGGATYVQSGRVISAEEAVNVALMGESAFAAQLALEGLTGYAERVNRSVQKRSGEWLTTKALERGPLESPSLSERFVSGLTGASPHLAYGEVSIPTAETMTRVGVAARPETLWATDIGWELVNAPKMGGIMLSKVPTESLARGLPTFFGLGKQLIPSELVYAEGEKLYFSGGKANVGKGYVKELGSFDRSIPEFDVREFMRQNKLLPFTTQTQLTRMGIYPYTPKLEAFKEPMFDVTRNVGFFSMFFAPYSYQKEAAKGKLNIVNPILLGKVGSRFSLWADPFLKEHAYNVSASREDQEEYVKQMQKPMLDTSTIQETKTKQIPQLVQVTPSRLRTMQTTTRPRDLSDDYFKRISKAQRKRGKVTYGMVFRGWPVASPKQFLERIQNA